MGLWQDKRTGKWKYAFEHEKKSYGGGGFRTKAEARAAREERRKQVLNPTLTPTAMAFSEVANTYLDWSVKRHAKKTHEYKRMVLREFLDYHGDDDITAITPHHLHLYLNTRPTTHNYNVHRKELCALFAFAQRQLQVIQTSPCWNLEKLPEDPPRKSIPTQEEFTRILAAARPDDRPLLIILVHTLARIDEILRLTWHDVNFERRTITLWTRKRKGGSLEARHLPMNETLYKTLQPMWQRRKQNEWVFYHEKEETRYNRRPKLMRSLCRRAGVPHYGFHAIRHFVATYLHDIEKVPTGVLSTLLGHKNKSTTEIYLHSVDEAAREAMRRLDDLQIPAATIVAVSGETGRKNGTDRTKKGLQ